MTSTDLLGPASASGAVTVRPGEGRTFGLLDSWFKDCTDALTDDGTAYEASFFNAVLANLRSIARGNGQTAGSVDIVTQDNTADDLLWRACQHLYQRAQPAYAVDSSSSANHIIIALTPAAPELKAGMRIRAKVAVTNTGPTDIVVNANSAVVAKTTAGADIPAGALRAGMVATFVFDGTYFQLQSPSLEGLPKASIATASIGSLPFATWTTHNLSLAASSNLSPVMSAASFTLPIAGTYLFVLSGGGTVITNNATNTGGAFALFKNGSLVDSGGVTTYLPSAANQTFKYQLAIVASIIPTDVLTFKTSSSATAIGDYNSATANAGVVDLVRLGA